MAELQVGTEKKMKRTIWTRLIALVMMIAILSGCGMGVHKSQTDDLQPGQEEQNKNGQTDTDHTDENKESEDNTVTDNTEISLDQKQKNSIAMLNYLSIIAEEINVSKDNRLALEEVYTTLMNNTNPAKIDDETQDHINNLMDTIKSYRLISVKRERLQYIYNQDKAATVKNAVPNPLAILSMTNSFNWKKLVASVAYTAVDSYSNYKAANKEVDQQFLISGWELDDEETEAIQKSRERAYNYMVDIVQKYGIEGNLSLNEKAIKDFALLCTEDNITRKIQFLESEENTYKMLGDYWLELADSYYENGDYQKCLTCIDKYQSLDTGIFRKDYEYAQVLPKAIIAVQETKKGNEYVQLSKTFADAIVQNTNNDDWSSRYFAAQVYIDLYAKTNDTTYLKEAYQIALNNVNLLVDEQTKLNQVYLNDVKEEELEPVDDKYLSEAEKKEQKKERKEEQKKLDEYNKALKTKRKIELPSLYEPLVLNCDLLFALAEELDIEQTEKDKIKEILLTKKNGVFLSKTVNDQYSFGEGNKYAIEYDKNEIVIPADLLVEECSVVVTLTDGDKETTYDDWKITKVKREGKTIDTFKTYFSSKKIKSYKWTKDTKITIEILNGDSFESVVFKYKVKEYKDNFVIPDKITFKRV